MISLVFIVPQNIKAQNEVEYIGLRDRAYPQGIAYNKVNGLVYVALSATIFVPTSPASIAEINATSREITYYNITVPEELNADYPALGQIAIDSNGDVWITIEYWKTYSGVSPPYTWIIKFYAVTKTFEWVNTTPYDVVASGIISDKDVSVLVAIFSKVLRIDSTTNAIADVYDMTGYAEGCGFVVADGTTIWVTSGENHKLIEYDTESRRVIGNVSYVNAPRGISVSDKYVYVCDYMRAPQPITICKIDKATLELDSRLIGPNLTKPNTEVGAWSCFMDSQNNLWWCSRAGYVGSFGVAKALSYETKPECYYVTEVADGSIWWSAKDTGVGGYSIMGETSDAFIGIVHNPPKTPDINRDNEIDILDVVQVTSRYSLHEGEPNWNETCDINSDKKIDILDVVSVTSAYGKEPYP